VDQRVSLITLAVDDLDRARTFYEAVGWEPTDVADGIVAFDLIDQTLCLYPRSDLARDMGVDVASLGTGGTTLACNVARAEDVQPVVERFRAAGGTVLRDAHEVFWGGTTSYVADPDGNVWEVAHNPFAPLGPAGAFRWHGFDEQGGPRPAPAPAAAPDPDPGPGPDAP